VLCLDTNLLIRFITGDDPIQAEAADRLIARALQEGESLFVSDHVLCELIWVLSSVFRLGKIELEAELEKLIYSTEIRLTTSSKATNAFAAFVAGSGDFADYLIREEALEAGCRAVATFDKKLLKEPGFIEP
jgi:predicted nucleic-acid-binding protein